ncbi:lipopolysaccharide biosynthesis protein [Falsiroseomonas sp. HW251]|uniref:lipopolysaccharide biosynthesis protein n=1 Tax=Falsiroseomonas sp. HW251 TaxID=3390998 RepID=UPI003D30F199
MSAKLSVAAAPTASQRRWPAALSLEGRISRLATASGGSLAVLVSGAALSYLAQVATARLIGPMSFGAYAYVLAWTTLLGHAATLGFRVSLLRLLPAYRAMGDWPRARGLARFSTWSTAVTACLAAGLGMAVVAISLGTGSEQAQAFLIGLCVVPFVALQLVVAASVRAWGGVVSALIPERILRDASAVVVLALVLAGGWLAPGAPAAALALVAGGFISLAASWTMVRRRKPPELDLAPPMLAPRDWLRPTFPLTVLMLADVLMSRAGTLVLGSIGAKEEAGVFAVAYSLSLLAALPRMAVASAFAPTVSDLHTRGATAKLQALSARGARLALAATLVVAVPLMLAAKPLLALFGPSFQDGAPTVVVLVLAQVFSAACGPQQHLLTMTGHERAAAFSLAVAVAANLALAVLLAGPMGLLGIALASGGSLVGWNLFLLVFAWCRLGLRPGLRAVSDDEGSDVGKAACPRTGAHP